MAATFRVHLADPAGQSEIRILILIPSSELLLFFPFFFSFLFIFIFCSSSFLFLFFFSLFFLFFSLFSCQFLSSHFFIFSTDFLWRRPGPAQKERRGRPGQVHKERRGQGSSFFFFCFLCVFLCFFVVFSFSCFFSFLFSFFSFVVLALPFRRCGLGPSFSGLVCGPSFSWLVVGLPILLGARFGPSFLWLGFSLLRFATPSRGGRFALLGVGVGTSFLGWCRPSYGGGCPFPLMHCLTFRLSSGVWAWGPSRGWQLALFSWGCVGHVLPVVPVGLSFSG